MKLVTPNQMNKPMTTAIDKQKITTELIGDGLVSKMIPIRAADSNKGDFGKVLVVTGSTGMTGSGCLASMAALRSGAGLVYTAVPASLTGIYGASLIEPIILPLEDKGAGVLTAESSELILEHIKGMSVAAVGPGLSVTSGTREMMERIIKESTVPLVIDADGLNAISSDVSVLKKLSVKAVLTPHPGEMARLTGLNINQVQEDRIGVAKLFSEEYGVAVVLKGNKTVIALPDGRIFINPTGNSGMATAGTGDVLTGIIAGLAAQGAEMAEAAIAGVYLHGRAGDIAAKNLGMYSVVASDLIKYLPASFNSGGHYGV